MITAAFPCQSQHYTLFCGLGSSFGVEIAEETSRRGELSCAGMTLAVFQHGRVEKFKKVNLKENPKSKMEDMSSALEEVFYYLLVYSSGQLRT